MAQNHAYGLPRWFGYHRFQKKRWTKEVLLVKFIIQGLSPRKEPWKDILHKRVISYLGPMQRVKYF
jgi:hypothetical protein